MRDVPFRQLSDVRWTKIFLVSLRKMASAPMASWLLWVTVLRAASASRSSPEAARCDQLPPHCRRLAFRWVSWNRQAWKTSGWCLV